MTFVGKLLTVVITTLSLLFLGVAVMTYSTHRNYKALVQGEGQTQGLRQQVNERKQVLQQRQQQVTELENRIALERACRRSALAVLETRAAQLRVEVATKLSEYEQLAAAHRDQVEAVIAAKREAKRLYDEVETLRADLQQALAARDEALVSVTDLTDRLYQGEGALRRLRERSEQLTALRGGRF